MQSIYTALAGINLGLIFGVALLGCMAVAHVIRGYRFTPKDERTALTFFAVMCMWSTVERLGAALVILLPGDNWVGIVTLVCRSSLGVTVWACAIWVLFFWASQSRT